MSAYDVKVTKNEAIAELVLQNITLEKALKEAVRESEERISALFEQIHNLEEDKNNLVRSSFSHSFFEEQMKDAFKKGEIPVPEIILNQRLPISSEFHIDLGSPDSVDVFVQFSSGSVSVSNSFVFKPVLQVYGKKDDNYPDFQPAVYVKPVFSPTKAKNFSSKKLTPKPLPTVKT